MLLFDEFQVILDEEDKHKFMAALKGLLDMRSYVQAIFGFGTFMLTTIASNFSGDSSIAEKFKSTYSPFPYTNTIFIPPLTQQGIRDMFHAWQVDCNIKLQDSMVDQIFDLTNG